MDLFKFISVHKIRIFIGGLFFLALFLLNLYIPIVFAQPTTILHYKFDDGSGNSAVDSSGNNFTGTLINGPVWTSGKVNGALDFDGVDDYVSSSYTGSPTVMTMTAWIKADSTGTTRPRIAAKNGEFEFYQDKSKNNIVFGRFFSGAWGYWQTPTGSLTNNTWYHVALVYDRSSTTNDPLTYINGVSQTVTEIDTPTGSALLSSNNYIIGSTGTIRFFDGVIDEFKIYTQALTAQEVLQEYNSANDTTFPTISITSPTGGTTVSGNVTITADANDNIAVSQVQFKVDGVNLGNVDASFPYSAPWDTTAGSNGSHDLTAVATDTAGNSTTSSPVNVTVNNPPQLTITQPLDGATINGSQVNVTYTKSGDLTEANHAHFRLDGGSTAMDIDFDGNYTFNNVLPGFHTLLGIIARADHSEIAGSDDTITFTTIIDSAPPIITNVQSINVTSNGATITWTTDEAATSQVEYGPTTSYGQTTVLDNTLVTSHSQNLTNLTPNTPYHFRVISNDATGNTGTSNDFTFTTTSPELKAHWKFDEGSGTTALDSSGNNNTATLINGPVWTVGVLNGALQFDGNNDYVNTTYTQSPQALTITAWVKVDSTGQPRPRIMHKNGEFEFLVNRATNQVMFGRVFSGAWGYWQTPTGSLSNNAWHHLALVYDRSSATNDPLIYIDSVSQNITETDTPTGSASITSNSHIIGSIGGTTKFFKGTIDDVRIYAKSLSASEVLNVYSEVAGDPRATNGEWAASFAWPTVAIHAALMPNGEVLSWGGESFNGGASANVWNSTTNTFTPTPMSPLDPFCAGQSFLPDGRLLVSGGHSDFFVGLTEQNIFDSTTHQWSAAAPMTYGRWYPTNTTLGDGRVLIVSGTIDCQTCYATIPEIYDPFTNTVTQLTGANLSIPMYPLNFVLPDGRVLSVGSSDIPTGVITRVLDINTQSWSTVDPIAIDGPTAVMYMPGQVMKPSANTYVLDMNQPSPSWQQTASMNKPRTLYTNATLLPDGNVLAIGGENSAGTPIYEAEVWSPVTKQWTLLAPMQIERLYHSTTLLLPDGRILAAGGRGNLPASEQYNAQIYSPPYLFKGARPTITSAPTLVQYGTNFQVSTPDAASISKVTFVRLGAVTHAFNMDQRFLDLSFTQGSGTLDIQAPANGNLAPPGNYMLFILNSAGVPSQASIVRI